MKYLEKIFATRDLNSSIVRVLELLKTWELFVLNNYVIKVTTRKTFCLSKLTSNVLKIWEQVIQWKYCYSNSVVKIVEDIYVVVFKTNGVFFIV